MSSRSTSTTSSSFPITQSGRETGDAIGESQNPPTGSTARGHDAPARPEPTPAELATLQALIDRSTRTATPSVADSLGYPPRQMTAAELIEFWRGARLVAMATVGPAGQPHIAPVHTEIAGTTLRVVVYDDAVRRADLARNPRVAFTAWGSDGAAAILYGRAREVPGSLREARPGQSGKPRRVVTIDVGLTRVYAMRARERSPEPREGCGSKRGNG
jgi:hypothetical protein